MASHLLNTVNAIVFIIISLISWILILSNMIQTLPTSYTRACSTTPSPRMGCWFPLFLGLLSKFPFNSLSACLPVLTDRWESYFRYPSLDMKRISVFSHGLSSSRLWFCTHIICLSSLGDSGLLYVCPSLLDLKRVVDLNFCSPFYLLGWSGNFRATYMPD